MNWFKVRTPNKYTSSTLMNLDMLIYRLKGKRCYWDGDSIVQENERGIKYEIRTHFPDWCFHVACYLQNNYPWTRRLLSL